MGLHDERYYRRPNISDGKNMVSCGNKVTNKSTISSGIKKGRVALVMRSNGISATFAVTYRTTPMGGVNVPIMRFIIMIRPKWIGLIPNFRTTGSRIGIRIIWAAIASMKQPMKSRKQSSTNKMMTGFSDKPTNNFPIICGTWALVMTHPKREAVITRAMITAFVSMVRRIIFGKSLILISLYESGVRSGV